MRACLALLVLLASQPAAAEGAPAPAAPAPYSLPFQLRPVTAPSVLRSDTSFASYQDAKNNHGTVIATSLLFSYKVLDRGIVSLAPLARFTLVGNFAPASTVHVTSFVNPLFGGILSIKLPHDLRFAFFLGLTLPLGMGGGDTPDAAYAAANKAAILARSAFDNAIFSVNDMTLIPGFDLSWTRYGLTIQIEATFFELFRVRGAAAQKDEYKTNFTTGLHIAYFVVKQLSLGVEVRYQRWLSTPVAVASDPTGTLRDNVTIAGGLRGHFNLGRGFWLRPALSYSHGLDDPMMAQSYHIVQLDVPMVFP